MVRSKIRGIHLTCKVANKCLNVRERIELVESFTNSGSLERIQLNERSRFSEIEIHMFNLKFSASFKQV